MTDKLTSILFSLGIYGYWLYLAGLNGWLNLWTTGLPLIWIGIKLVGISKLIFQKIVLTSSLEKLFLLLLACQFCLYSLGLFVPETGFDALWYHLPQAQVYASTGRIAKIPEIIYSTMPRLADLYFIPALTFDVTPKIVSFLFSLLFSSVTYLFARLYLSRTHSLLVILIVNSTYVISWLSSSAYIDLTRATFELISLFCLLQAFKAKSFLNRKYFVLATIFTGFALSTKFQSLTYLIALSPIFLLHPRSKLLNLKQYFLYIVLALPITLPWLLENYFQSGHPLYPLSDHVKQLDQLTHAGASSPTQWLTSRLTRLPFLFWDLTLHPTDFLTPVFLILLPLVIWRLRFVPRYLVAWVLCYLVLWWFLPPPETRYLLTTLAPLSVVSLKAVLSLPSQFSRLKSSAMFFIILSLCLNFGFRLYSSRKYLPVILGQITPQQYLDSQTSSFNHGVITKFYSGHWQNYQYP